MTKRWDDPEYMPMAIRCDIRGPYLPVGDTDWECRTHKVLAELRDPDNYPGPPARRMDVYCPIGQPTYAP